MKRKPALIASARRWCCVALPGVGIRKRDFIRAAVMNKAGIPAAISQKRRRDLINHH